MIEKNEINYQKFGLTGFLFIFVLLSKNYDTEELLGSRDFQSLYPVLLAVAASALAVAPFPISPVVVTGVL